LLSGTKMERSATFQVRQPVPDGHDEEDHEDVHQGSAQRERNAQRARDAVHGVVDRFGQGDSDNLVILN
jgi:hypothetical protein